LSPNIVCVRLDSEHITEEVKKEFEEIVKDLDKKPLTVKIVDSTKLCVDEEFLDYLFLAKEEVIDRMG
jgi:hypothetical protein